MCLRPLTAPGGIQIVLILPDGDGMLSWNNLRFQQIKVTLPCQEEGALYMRGREEERGAGGERRRRRGGREREGRGH